MNQYGTDELIFDVLFLRKSSSETSCFSVNESSNLLLQRGEAVVSRIEANINEFVVPILLKTNKEDFNFDPGSDFRNSSPLPGLAILFQIYWRLTEPNPDRSIAFVRRLPPKAEYEAIMSLVQAYNPHRNPPRSMPILYGEYLRMNRDSSVVIVSKAADFATRKLNA